MGGARHRQFGRAHPDTVGQDALCAFGSHPRGRDRTGPRPSPCPSPFRAHSLSARGHVPQHCAGRPLHVLVQTEEGGSPEQREQPGLPTRGKFRWALTAPTRSVLSRTASKEEHGFQSGGYSPGDHRPASFSLCILGSSAPLLGLSCLLADPCSVPAPAQPPRS